MTNLLARRMGAQDRIIPLAFRDQFRKMGFKVGGAPEGLPIVEEPMMLDDLLAKKQEPKPDARAELDTEPVFSCEICGTKCKSPRGLTQHHRAKHA